MGQHLQRHVLEGTGGTVPQLQAVSILVHLADRGHLADVELVLAVCLGGKGGQLRGGKIVQIGLHDVHGPLLVGHIREGLQPVLGQLGKHLGGQQPAVLCKPLCNGLRSGEPHLLVSCAHIVHTLLTTLIRLLKNTSRTSASE